MDDDMFAPPINRAMQVLDRSFFQKTVPLSLARIFSPKDISRCRKDLDRSRDVLSRPRIPSIRPDPDVERAKWGGKCLVLQPHILHSDKSTWSLKLHELVRDGTLDVIPHELELDYSYFSYLEIMNAIIPPPNPDEHEDTIPTGYSRAGHVAHLNLRQRYLPYKHLIGTVLADKNPDIRTVINKVEHIDASNKFRVFPYEVLYGPDDMHITLKEQNCTFQFDWAKVYWNTRLHTEHERLCNSFKEGEAICDVMAGVGPFAIPAGKKHCFVYANDLNPDSSSALLHNISINKVGGYVRHYNTDGHDFIRKSAVMLLTKPHVMGVHERLKYSHSDRTPREAAKLVKTLIQPKTFQHYVMNLPASAVEFLPDFIGLYARIPNLPVAEARKLFAPHTDSKLPMVHVYCFGTKTDDEEAAAKEVCALVSGYLQHTITPQTPDTHVHNVRGVSNTRSMYCVSFRLPEEVAFRES